MVEKKQKWVTQKELATELGLNSQNIVQNWIQRGRIKWKIIHGIRMVDRTSLKPAKRGRPVIAKKKVKSN